MMVYAKSLLVGLCAGAVVVAVCWRVGLCPSVVYPPPPSSHSSAVVPVGDGESSVSVTFGSMTKTTVPWYVAAMAGLALVTASGWQLRRLSWRDRR
jgi:hypothetical protein